MSIIVFALGIMIVFLNPLSPLAISLGMFLVAVAILSVAIQVFFPAEQPRPVELRVVAKSTVRKRVRPKPKKKAKKVKRSRKKTKKARKTKRKRKR